MTDNTLTLQDIIEYTNEQHVREVADFGEELAKAPLPFFAGGLFRDELKEDSVENGAFCIEALQKRLRDLSENRDYYGVEALKSFAHNFPAILRADMKEPKTADSFGLYLKSLVDKRAFDSIHAFADGMDR